MNNILIALLFFLFAFNSSAQYELSGKKFKTDVLIGSTDHGWSYKIHSMSLSDAETNPWGYFLQLNADGSFEAFNQNKCGNDCRLKVSGTYTIEDGIITFIAGTLRYMDICVTQPKQEINSSLGAYEIKETNGTITLVRVS